MLTESQDDVAKEIYCLLSCRCYSILFDDTRILLDVRPGELKLDILESLAELGAKDESLIQFLDLLKQVYLL